MKIPLDFWTTACSLMEQDSRYQRLLTDCKACESELIQICEQLSPENRKTLDTFICSSLEMGFRLAELVAAHYSVH